MSIILAGALVGAGSGLLAGGAAMTTKKGQEINEKLHEAFEFFDERVAKFLPLFSSKDSYLKED